MNRLRREFCYLATALQLLTRLPSPRLEDFEPAWTYRASRYFPLVGALVGAVGAGVLYGAAQLWSPTVAAILAVTTTMAATGALHEDGLADAADGLVGGRTAEQRLAIMKDSSQGTYGVLALVIAFALKVASLAQLEPHIAALALIAMHAFARTAPVVVMAASRYVRDADAARIAPSDAGVRPGEAVFACAAGTAFAVALVGPVAAFVAMVVAGVVAGALAVYAMARIGGHTGDVLGAVEQGAEIGFLLGLTGVIGHSLSTWPG